MAITLISEPEKFQPSGNAIEFVFDSSNNGRCDFRYVMDIYINGLRIGQLVDLHTANTVEFEVAGDAKITGLSGSGSRLLETDADGNITASSGSGTLSGSKLFIYYNFS